MAGDFDPDAFLAEPEPAKATGFDPDAFLAEPVTEAAPPEPVAAPQPTPQPDASIAPSVVGFQPDYVNKAREADIARINEVFKASLETKGDDADRLLAVANKLNLYVDDVRGALPEFEKTAALAGWDGARWYDENPMLREMLLRHPKMGTVVIRHVELGPVMEAINSVTDTFMDSVRRNSDPTRFRKRTVDEIKAIDAVERSNAAERAKRDAPRDEERVSFPDSQFRQNDKSVAGATYRILQRGEEASAQYGELHRLERKRMMLEFGSPVDGKVDEEALREVNAELHDARLRNRPQDVGADTGVERSLAEATQGIISSAITIRDSAAGMGMGAGVGAVVGGVAGAAITRTPAGAAVGSVRGAKVGAAVGGKAAAYVSMVDLETVASYENIRVLKTDKGLTLTPREAFAAALIEGVLKGSLESMSFGQQTKLLKNTLPGKLRELVTKSPKFRAYLGRVALEYAKSVATESTTEGLQDLVEQAGAFYESSLKDMQFSKRTPDAQRVLQNVQGGFSAAAVMGGVSSTIALGHQKLVDSRAEVMDQAVPKILDLAQHPVAQDSALEFAQTITDNTAKNGGKPLTSFHVDAKAARRFLQKTHESLAESAQAFEEAAGPGFGDKFLDALTEGGKVEITLPQVIAKWGSSELGKALAGDTTTDPKSLTPNERAEQEARNEAEAQAIAEKEIAKAEEAALLTERRAAMEEQLVASGMDRQVAKVGATLVTHFARTQEKDFNKTAAQLFPQTLVTFAKGDEGAAQSGGVDPLVEKTKGFDATARATKLFIDETTGLRNRRAWDATPRTPGTSVGILTLVDTKAINDEPSGGHDVTNDAFTKMAPVMRSIDPNAARSGTNFLFEVKSQADLDAAVQLVREAMPKGLSIEGALAPDTEAAFMALDASTDKKRLPGPNGEAPTLPPRGGTNFKLSELENQPFAGSQPVPHNISPELLDRATKTEGQAFVNEALRDPVVPQLLTRTGFELDSHPWVSAYDLRGLKLLNETHGKAMGDKAIKAFGEAMVRAGGVKLSAAHFSGDEYAAGAATKAELERFNVRLEAELERVRIPVTVNGKAEVYRPRFRVGIGEKTYGKADRALNTAKRAEVAGGVGGVPQGQPVSHGGSGGDVLGSAEAASGSDQAAAGRDERLPEWVTEDVDAHAAETIAAREVNGPLRGEEAEAIKQGFNLPESITNARAAVLDFSVRAKPEQAGETQQQTVERALEAKHRLEERQQAANAFLDWVENIGPGLGEENVVGQREGVLKVSKELKRETELWARKEFNIIDPASGLSDLLYAAREGIPDDMRRAKQHAARTAYERAKRADAQAAFATHVLGRSSTARLFQKEARPRWYSAVERAVTAAKQAKNTGAAWWSLLTKTPGVKLEELEFLGLKRFLDEQKGSVSKEQIQKFVSENRVEVTERVLSEDPAEIAAQKQRDVDGLERMVEQARKQAEEAGSTVGAEAEALAKEGLAFARAGNSVAAIWKFQAAEMTQARAGELPTYDAVAEAAGRLSWDKPGTHYETYKLGGEEPGSYKELLLYTPTAKDYEAPHFANAGQGLLAHARTSIHTDASGAKVLFIEEVQSDLQQKRKEQDQARAELNAKRAELATLQEEKDGILAKHGTGKEAYEVFDRLNERIGPLKDEIAALEKAVPATPEELANARAALAAQADKVAAIMGRWQALHDALPSEAADKALEAHGAELREAQGVLGDLELARQRMMESAARAVPDAPFKANWEELVLKRMVMEATEQGIKKLGWTTGAQQSKRYDLAQQVDEVLYYREANQLEALKNGSVVTVERGVTPDKLSAYVGAPAAERLLKAKPKSYEVRGEDGNWTVVDEHGHEVSGTDLESFRYEEDARAHAKELNQKDGGALSIRGADLSIGGEGMKVAYDVRIPSVMRKLLKPSGGTVQQEVIDVPEGVKAREEDGVKVWTATIPPALSETVKKEGMRLFQKEKQTDSPAFKAWFKSSKVTKDGKPRVVFHGTARPDRIADRFRKDRATSGPMAMFTTDPEIASSYSVNKKDTSLEMPDDYSGWFKANLGGRTVELDKAWPLLTAQQRVEIRAKLPHVVLVDDTGSAHDGQYMLGGNDEFGLAGKSHWDFEIRQAGGNVLKAAKEIWLNGGSLFGSEAEFMKVLDLGGAKGIFEFDDPHRQDSSVYPVYLSIQKPLDTNAIPKKLLKALEKAAKTAPERLSERGADLWDKNTRDPKEWVAQLKEDYAAGKNSFVWTSIPDWVTSVLKEHGYDGIHDTGNKSGDGSDHEVWIPFDDTQVKSATGNSGAFDPNDPSILKQGESGNDNGDSGDVPKGYTEVPEARGLHDTIAVFLNSKADASTVIHESAHAFLEHLGDLAERADAPQRTKDTYAAALKWMGVSDRSGIKRDHHEQFARSFEAYLFEGKAPTVELASVFQKFKLWLTAIYRTIANIPEQQINPEIRKVFDALLATEDEIAAFQKKQGADFTDKPKGVSDAQWAAKVEAMREEVSELTRKAELHALKDRLRVTEKWWKDGIRKAEKEAAVEYEELPARRAQLILQGDHSVIKKPVLLDKARVDEVLGKKRAAGIRTVKEGGVNPDTIAELAGYATGEAMLKDVVALQSKEVWVRETAESRMEAAHPSVLEDRTELRALVEDALSRYTEKRLLAEGFVKGDEMASLKRAAVLMVERRELNKLNPSLALTRERAAAKEKAAATAKGDWTATHEAARNEALNAALYRALLDAKEERGKLEETALELNKEKAMARLGKASVAYRDAVAYLLGSLAFRELDPELTDSTLTAAVAQMNGDGAVIGDPDWLAPLRAALAKQAAQPDLGKLTVAEGRVLSNAFKQLTAAARGRTELTDGEKRADKEAVKAAALEEITGIPAGPGGPEGPEGLGGRGGGILPARKGMAEAHARTRAEKLAVGLNALDGFLLNPIDMVRDLTGDNQETALWKYIVNPLRRAAFREADLMAESVKPIVEALQKLPAHVRARLSDKVDGDALFPNHVKNQGVDSPRYRYEILMMALNAGSESSMGVLTEGRNISEQQVRAALSMLTKEEIDWANTVLKAVESLREPAFALEERETGLRPEEVVARPMVLPNGTLNGGYFPLKAIKDASDVGQRAAGGDMAQLFDPTYSRPVTAHGHLKSRTGAFYPLSLAPNVILKHLGQVTHDIAFREAVKSVASLVLDKDIAAALQERLGAPKTGEFLKWLKDIGGGSADHANVLNDVTSWVRANMATSLLSGLSTAFGNLANLPTAVASTKLKSKHLAAAMGNYAASPIQQREFALSKSGMLRAMDNDLVGGIKKELADFKADRFDRGLEWVKHAGMAAMRGVDTVVSTAVWLAAYRQGLAQQMDDGAAVRFADDILAQVQPMSSNVERAGILRDKKGVGGLVLFYGYLSVAYRAQHRIAAPLMTQEFKDAGVAKKVAIAGGVAGQMLAFYVAYSVLGELLMGRGPEDGDKDDDEPENDLLKWRNWFARKLAIAPLTTLPLVPFGAIVDAATVGKKPNPRTDPLSGLALQTATAGAAIKKAAKEDASDEDVRRATSEAFRTVGLYKGVPVRLIDTTGRYLWDITAGDREVNGLGDFTSGVLYGEKDKQGDNPFKQAE